ncbi:hypothetical protein HBI56_193160 [Parastagonospora nodorum]|nr:hypothetical protein HBH53_231790 [Parastagonospora nodorum]KAH3957528.1 hypothetical protein HBH51_223760 [Parastagonospora nodorum]KAH3964283.1 hypothetical protein HBH52_211090 [Parastagonospora nodorum]KAH3996263.1 hypothetical protein HBI10_162860 [Parastagonospora nodorum]KAH4019619.1 hypothetical protein HBI13_127220 [Parastagonospora nodorum]
MYFSSIATSMLLATAVSASPLLEQRKAHPEVIPGPGLPSLASLGLTTAQLYETPVPGAEFSAQFDLKCGPNNRAYGPVNDVIACYNYLRNLGGRACQVPGNSVLITFCTAGNGKATGQGLNSNAQSSACSDVAGGLLQVINGCTRSDQTVAGFQAANGNGNLIVGGVNRNY